MKEILFMGKQKDNGEWVEGGIAFNGDRCFITRRTKYIPDTRNLDIVELYEKYPTYVIENIEVIPETVGQYTGKELNGKKLFTGDVVETYVEYDDEFGCTESDSFYSVVIWDEENFCFALKIDDYIQPFNDWEWDSTTIIGHIQTTKIGSIHDNPELIGE